MTLAFPLTVAAALSLHGLRKRSLSPSGALCAFIVGLCMFTGPLRAFGTVMIVFYLVGSKATKYGKQVKCVLEDGHHEAGNRSAWQVLSNSFSALCACALWNALFAQESMISSSIMGKLAIERRPYNPQSWCPYTARGWSRGLLLVALGHFACCMGDTLASELGILSSKPPVLITSFKVVPPGTNGAVSRLGLLVSAAGGILMGLTLATSMVIENAICRLQWVEIFSSAMVYGCLAGFFGSLLDSLLGATLQRTRYLSDKKLILQDESKPPSSAEVVVIAGRNILTNNQVNLVSSTLMAIMLGAMG